MRSASFLGSFTSGRRSRGRRGDLLQDPIFARALELGDFLVSDTGGSKEKPRVLPVVVDPMTFWRLVQMLYYTTKPQETRGCPLSHVFTRLKIHYHIFMIVHLFSAGQVILTT